MKAPNLLKILLLAVVVCLPVPALKLLAAPGNRYATTIYVTGPLTNGMTLTVNGDTRTWQTNFTGFADIILSNGGPNSVNTTNLFGNILATPFFGLLSSQPQTNQVKLVGQVDQVITVSLGGTWGSFTTITNSVNPGTSVVVPMSSFQPPVRTNVASQLVSDLTSYSTNKFGVNLFPAAVATNITSTVPWYSFTSGPNYTLYTNGVLIAGSFVDGVLLLDGTRPMTGALDGGGFKVVNVADGVNPQDVATFNQLGTFIFADAQYPNALLLDGTRAMAAALNHGGFKSVNMADGSNPQDGATFFQLGSFVFADAQYPNALLLDGTRPMTGALDFATFNGINAADPTNPQDVATKAYVDSFSGGVQTNAVNRWTALQRFTTNTAVLSDVTNLVVRGTFNQVPLSFSLPITFIGSGSNWVTFAHGTVPSGKTVTLNYAQSLMEDGTDPATNQVLRIYDASNASTLLETNGNWSGSITITNLVRWYARFENNSTNDFTGSASVHGNIK